MFENTSVSVDEMILVSSFARAAYLCSLSAIRNPCSTTFTFPTAASLCTLYTTACSYDITQSLPYCQTVQLKQLLVVPLALSLHSSLGAASAEPRQQTGDHRRRPPHCINGAIGDPPRRAARRKRHRCATSAAAALQTFR